MTASHRHILGWTLGVAFFSLPPERSSTAETAAQRAPSFTRVVDAYLDRFAQYHPSIAAGNGIHAHDDRLEDFSAKVIQGLDRLDWHGTRQIIHTLVRRIEIDRDSVEVVFRVPPMGGPPEGGSQLPTRSNLQHCTDGYARLRGLCGVLRRRAGIVPNSECGTIPGLQRTTKRCCAAPGKSGEARAYRVSRVPLTPPSNRCPRSPCRICRSRRGCGRRNRLAW